MSFQAEITFVDKNTPNDDGFTLVMSLKMKYDEFARIVGDYLKYDPLKLQFFRSNTYDLKTPINQAIKYNAEFQLKDAFNLNTNKQQQKKLYFQKLTIKVSELEERRQFKCLWISSNFKTEKELLLMPSKKASVKELLSECKNELFNQELITQQQLSDEQGFKLRLVEIVSYRLNRIIKEDMLIEGLEAQMANRLYRVEQILPEELSLNNSLVFNGGKGEEYLLPLAHFTKEIYTTFGTPFFLKVRQGELFKDIKLRIQRRLDVNDKEFATVILFFFMIC